jgi:hypothetical protein
MGAEPPCAGDRDDDEQQHDGDEPARRDGERTRVHISSVAANPSHVGDGFVPEVQQVRRRC